MESSSFHPKVSIVIPVYNGADYMREAIDSALAQTYDNIEILVVNDGSTDGGATDEIARSYGDRIRYWHKENGGVASALNFAIDKMSGEYFSWLSHDDVYYPEKVARQVEVLRSSDDKEIVLWSDFSLIDEHSEPLGVGRTPEYDVPGIRYALLMKPSVHGCTLLIPRRAFTVCGTFREELKTTQDYALWFEIGKHFEFVQMTDLLVKARQHRQQGSRTIATHSDEKEALYTSFLDDYFNRELTEEPDDIAKGMRCLAFAGSMLDMRLPKASVHALLRGLSFSVGSKMSVAAPLYLETAGYGRKGMRYLVRLLRNRIESLIKKGRSG